MSPFPKIIVVIVRSSRCCKILVSLCNSLPLACLSTFTTVERHGGGHFSFGVRGTEGAPYRRRDKAILIDRQPANSRTRDVRIGKPASVGIVGFFGYSCNSANGPSIRRPAVVETELRAGLPTYPIWFPLPEASRDASRPRAACFRRVGRYPIWFPLPEANRGASTLRAACCRRAGR